MVDLEKGCGEEGSAHTPPTPGFVSKGAWGMQKNEVYSNSDQLMLRNSRQLVAPVHNLANIKHILNFAVESFIILWHVEC